MNKNWFPRQNSTPKVLTCVLEWPDSNVTYHVFQCYCCYTLINITWGWKLITLYSLSSHGQCFEQFIKKIALLNNWIDVNVFSLLFSLFLISHPLSSPSLHKIAETACTRWRLAWRSNGEWSSPPSQFINGRMV